MASEIRWRYSVNASVPKTLVQFLIRWIADTKELGPKAGGVCVQSRGPPSIRVDPCGDSLPQSLVRNANVAAVPIP